MSNAPIITHRLRDGRVIQTGLVHIGAVIVERINTPGTRTFFYRAIEPVSKGPDFLTHVQQFDHEQLQGKYARLIHRVMPKEMLKRGATIPPEVFERARYMHEQSLEVLTAAYLMLAYPETVNANMGPRESIIVHAYAVETLYPQTEVALVETPDGSYQMWKRENQNFPFPVEGHATYVFQGAAHGREFRDEGITPEQCLVRFTEHADRIKEESRKPAVQ